MSNNIINPLDSSNNLVLVLKDEKIKYSLNSLMLDTLEDIPDDFPSYEIEKMKEYGIRYFPLTRLEVQLENNSIFYFNFYNISTNKLLYFLIANYNYFKEKTFAEFMMLMRDINEQGPISEDELIRNIYNILI